MKILGSYLEGKWKMQQGVYGRSNISTTFYSQASILQGVNTDSEYLETLQVGKSPLESRQ